MGFTLRSSVLTYILSTKEARLNADRQSKSAQGPCGAHSHETGYYHGEGKDAYVGSLRMPQIPLERVH
jgi:hypothetical protein